MLRSCELFAKGKEILIEHQGEMYRLQLTRNGKLILIKYIPDHTHRKPAKTSQPAEAPNL